MQEITEDLTKRLVSQMNLEQQSAVDLVAKLSSLELVRLWSGLRFIERHFDALTLIFFMESLTAMDPGTKSQKLKQLFVQNSSTQDKLDLVDGYMFSEQYTFGGSHGITRHLMFADFEVDTHWKKNNLDPSWTMWQDGCSTGTSSMCFCLKWLEENLRKLDLYVAGVVGKIYKMRCAVAHEAFPVIFLPEYEDFDSANMIGTSTIVDAFPWPNGKFITYECSLHPCRFQEIMLSTAREFLMQRYL